MAQVPLKQRRWRRDEYERLVELGVFDGEPLELIGGDLIVAEPRYPYHASGISLAEQTVRAALPPGWIVRTQSPVALDDGWAYGSITTLAPPAVVAPLAFPSIEIAVADLVPQRGSPSQDSPS